MTRPIVFGPAASALFRLEAPTAVSAGAGSGKTTALVELCVRLLSGEATGTPCDPGAIVAITFTRFFPKMASTSRGTLTKAPPCKSSPP